MNPAVVVSVATLAAVLVLASRALRARAVPARRLWGLAAAWLGIIAAAWAVASFVLSHVQR